MHNAIYDVLGLAIFVYFIIRQVSPRRPTRLRFYIMPLIGLYLAYHNLPHPVPSSQIWDAVISVAISVPFGIAQAYFTRFYQLDGQWVLQGDWRYLVSWLVLFASHLVTVLLFSAGSHQVTPVTWVIALEVAVVWGLRSVVLHLRFPRLSTVLATARAR